MGGGSLKELQQILHVMDLASDDKQLIISLWTYKDHLDIMKSLLGKL